MNIFSRRFLIITATIIVFAACGYYTYQKFYPEEDATALLTAPVTRGDIENAVLATGTLEAFEQVDVGAQVSGQLMSLDVELGDKVKKDQLIGEIDSVPQQNALKNAEAALENMKAQRSARQAALKQSELSYKRLKQLVEADAAARGDYETAEAALDTARADIAALNAQIKQAEISADTAKVNLGYTKIVSPIDGIVVAIVTKAGQTVNANQTAPTIIRVANLETMTVKAQIAEADVTKVVPGQTVYFTILGEPGHKYFATLRAIEPAPESASTASSAASSASSNEAIYYNGLFDVPNEDGKLRISMTAEVSIVLDDAKDAVVIPVSALGPRGKDGSYSVTIIGKDGKKQQRDVKIGINNNIQAQVLEGVSEGETILMGETAEDGSQSTIPRRFRGGPMGM